MPARRPAWLWLEANDMSPLFVLVSSSHAAGIVCVHILDEVKGIVEIAIASDSNGSVSNWFFSLEDATMSVQIMINNRKILWEMKELGVDGQRS